MKKLILISALLIFACSGDDSSNDNNNNDDNNNDIDNNNNNSEFLNCDGNPFPTIVYGTQEWTVENACYITYRDGTPIPQETDPESYLNTGAWYYLDNDPTKPILYNWYAVMGIHDFASMNDPSLRKEFAPAGWHVPSDSEWTTLEEHLIANGYNYDGTTTGNKIAKAMASTTGWYSSTYLGAPGNDQSLNNSSGFNAFPEGKNGWVPNNFDPNVTFIWSSTDYGESFAWNRYMSAYDSGLRRDDSNKQMFYSVRFVKD